ncbi:MAG: carbohydrate ABC transporter permease [Clostridia bacterium]|nr:carbohydrate ABC transporter permease [Clostridia bacterium]
MKLKSLVNQRKNRSLSGTIALMVFILAVAAFMVFPLILILGNAFKPLSELWLFPPRLLPIRATTDNFTDLFSLAFGSTVPLTRYLSNTIVITVAGTAGHIFLSSMCAFQFAKRKFPGSKVLFTIIVLSLMFNATVTSIPNYLVMAKLGLIDTLWAIIIPTMGTPLGLYLMKNFMETSIPDAIIEAATVDGANEWVIYKRIVMPNTKPAWMTLILLQVQTLWATGNNGFIFSEEKKTLAYALSQIGAAGLERAGIAAAVSVIMLIVPFSIFIFTQSNVMQTMSTSGMKD